jgi:membrane associated rhomboid family serine protease
MFQSIWDEVKREFQHGNMVTRIIIVNAFVFVVVNIVKIAMSIPGQGVGDGFGDFLHFFTMPSTWHHFITHPWSLFTSIFLHVDFSHIFWNMIAFYWFGRIVGDLLGNHRILPLYLMGGAVGNILYFLMANYTAYGMVIGGYALGASAAMMAMVACAANIAPDYNFNVLLIGPVKLKYIALALIFLDFIAIADNFNAGGSFAHLGGAAFGFLYASQLQKGIDMGKWLENIIAWVGNLFSGKKRTNMRAERGGASTYEPRRTANTTKKEPSKGFHASDTEGDDQARLDAILDKIKQRGYDSLSREEKEFLFNASKK